MAEKQIAVKADLRGFIENMEDEELFAELHEGLYQMDSSKRSEHTGHGTLSYLYFHLQNQMLGLCDANEFKVEVNGELLTMEEAHQKFGVALITDYGGANANVMLEEEMREFVIYVLQTSELEEKERLIEEVKKVKQLTGADGFVDWQ